MNFWLNAVLSCPKTSLWTLLAAIYLLPPTAAWAAPGNTLKCEQLSELSIKDGTLTSTSVIQEQPSLPAYCRVQGAIRPAINFEMRLPLADWNGKFFMAGCGGFCGKLLADKPGYSNSINVALKRNYAVVTTDAGHYGQSAVDGIWAYENRQAEIDWAYRSIPEVSNVSKQIIYQFYDRKQDLSYFSGCSNGGRMGALAAQRYPDMFDGILIGAPALDWRTLAVHGAWVTHANTAADGSWILDYRKLNMIKNAVMSHCDAKDGLKDGEITDPRQCDFKPAILQCKTDQNTQNCLSSAEVTTLEKWYAPMPKVKDIDWTYRISYGSEPYWPKWLSTPDSRRGIYYLFLDGLYKYILFEKDPGPDFSALDFKRDRDLPKMEYMRKLYQSFNPDLKRFKAAGGKAIMYQGWSDPAAVPEAAIGYYEDVTKFMGGAEKTKDFFRLFMVPGTGHCFESPNDGTDQFDALTTLENWVEKDKAPDSILAHKKGKDGKISRTRPLCPYPQMAKYNGSGDINKGGSFQCQPPEK